MNKGTLEGITVIDLTRVLAGPYCTMFLADMGANVIKVEVPGKGDDTRTYAPSFHGESAYFINLNRNKRSLTLNLKSAKGKQILKDLIKKADILIENFRPGTMEKLGLGYDVLKEVNPKLVYGCISGFGQYGPYHDRPGYDIVAQAMGGMMDVTGFADGLPTKVGPAIADNYTGALLAIGILLRIGNWYKRQLTAATAAPVTATAAAAELPRRKIRRALLILTVLVFSKYFYIACMTNYFTFFLMDKFAFSVQDAQYSLFAFLAASAAGTVIGGPLGDRIGRKYVIWGSILGAAPFALMLPYAGSGGAVVLAILVGLIISSAFSAIVVYATDLMPGRVGMIAGLFFGLMFGLGGLGSAFFGWLADLVMSHIGIDLKHRELAEK